MLCKFFAIPASSSQMHALERRSRFLPRGVVKKSRFLTVGVLSPNAINICAFGFPAKACFELLWTYHNPSNQESVAQVPGSLTVPLLAVAQRCSRCLAERAQNLTVKLFHVSYPIYSVQSPGMTQSRLLPTVLLAASSWLLISLFGSQQSLGVARHR